MANELSVADVRYVAPPEQRPHIDNPPCGLTARCVTLQVALPKDATIVAVEGYAREHLAADWQLLGPNAGIDFSRFDGNFQSAVIGQERRVSWTFKNWRDDAGRDAKMIVRYTLPSPAADLSTELAQPLAARLLDIDKQFTALATKLLKPADSNFVFRELVQDALLRSSDVETLVSHAASLIDRAARDRDEWQDLGARWFQTALELKSLAEGIAIHADEIAAGFYLQDQLRALAQLSAEGDAARGYENASVSLEALLPDLQAAIELQASLNGLIAWMSANPLSEHDFGEPRHTYDLGNGVAGPKPAVIELLERDLSRREGAFRTAMNDIQRLLQKGGLDASSRRVGGDAANFDWEARNVEFKLRRDALEKALLVLRADAFTQPDGLLNYARRMDDLQARIVDDMRNAYARMAAAKEGLATLFGHDIPLPVVSTPISLIEGSAPFEDMVRWIREAVDYLARLASRTQNVVLPLSLHTRTGGDWASGLAAGSWKLTLTPMDFRGQSRVRLRGISCFVELAMQTVSGMWQ